YNHSDFHGQAVPGQAERCVPLPAWSSPWVPLGSCIWHNSRAAPMSTLYPFSLTTFRMFLCLFLLYGLQKCILGHFLLIDSAGITLIRERTEHLIFCQLFHSCCRFFIQLSTAGALQDGVHPAGINGLDRVIVCKLPLLPASQISDLSGSPFPLVAGGTTGPVFGCS